MIHTRKATEKEAPTPPYPSEWSMDVVNCNTVYRILQLISFNLSVIVQYLFSHDFSLYKPFRSSKLYTNLSEVVNCVWIFSPLKNMQ